MAGPALPRLRGRARPQLHLAGAGPAQQRQQPPDPAGEPRADPQLAPEVTRGHASCLQSAAVRSNTSHAYSGSSVARYRAELGDTNQSLSCTVTQEAEDGRWVGQQGGRGD